MGLHIFPSNITQCSAIAGLSFVTILHRRPLRSDAVVVVALLGLCVAYWLQLATLASIPLLPLAFYALVSAAIFEALWRISPLHPLSRFPGPIVCKLNGLFLARIVHTGKRHSYIRDLHDQYGTFVRTGSNSVSVASVTAAHAIYASSSAMSKAAAYSDVRGGLKGQGLFSMRTKEESAARKRIWTRAFSNKAIEAYQPIVVKRTEQLLDTIIDRKEPDGSIALSTYLRYWAFDISGDVTSGSPRDYVTLENGDPIGFLAKSHSTSQAFEIFCEVPWLLDILTLIPGVKRLNPMQDLEAYARNLIITRQSHSSEEFHDFMSYLLCERGPADENLSLEDMIVDVLLSLQAGSDTVSGALIMLVYFVLADVSVYKRLRAELDAVIPDPSQDIDDKTLSSLPYLSAVIEETIRLGSTFHGLPREVPEGGAVIDGTYIPAGTTVSVTSYVLHTSPDIFWPAPALFRPDRWLPEGLGPDSRVDKTAILAFSAGAFGCLGKVWAKRLLRYGAAKLFLTMDMRFSSRFDAGVFLRGVSHTRAATFEYPLQVEFTRRKGY